MQIGGHCAFRRVRNSSVNSALGCLLLRLYDSQHQPIHSAVWPVAKPPTIASLTGRTYYNLSFELTHDSLRVDRCEAPSL